MASSPVLPTAPTLNRPKAWRRVGSLFYWAVIATLLGANVWWVVRDLKPRAELKTIAGWVQQDRFAEAENALREHLRRSPHDGGAMVLLARTKIGQGDPLAAARILHGVPPWWPGKPDQRLREGQIYYSIDHMSEAEAAWAQCVRNDPLHPLSPQSRAFSQSALGLLKIFSYERRLDEARALIWRIYEHADPVEREDLIKIRLETEFLVDPPAKSAETLRRYLTADPEDWQARRALAVVSQSLGNGEEALKLIVQCVQARPDDPLVRRDLLAIVRDQGKQERLQNELERVPASAETNGAVWKYRGVVRERTGDTKGAAEAYQRAIELGTGDTEVFYRLGVIEHRLGLPKQAARDIEHSQRLADNLLKLYPAFWNYLEASKPDSRKADARAGAIERLASICTNLDWVREADALRQLAPKP